MTPSRLPRSPRTLTQHRSNCWHTYEPLRRVSRLPNQRVRLSGAGRSEAHCPRPAIAGLRCAAAERSDVGQGTRSRGHVARASSASPTSVGAYGDPGRGGGRPAPALGGESFVDRSQSTAQRDVRRTPEDRDAVVVSIPPCGHPGVAEHRDSGRCIDPIREPFPTQPWPAAAFSAPF